MTTDSRWKDSSGDSEYQQKILDEACALLNAIQDKLAVASFHEQDTVALDEKAEQYMEAVAILGKHLDYMYGMERIVKGLVLKLGGDVTLTPALGRETNKYEMEQHFSHAIPEGGHGTTGIEQTMYIKLKVRA